MISLLLLPLVQCSRGWKRQPVEPVTAWLRTSGSTTARQQYYCGSDSRYHYFLVRRSWPLTAVRFRTAKGNTRLGSAEFPFSYRQKDWKPIPRKIENHWAKFAANHHENPWWRHVDPKPHKAEPSIPMAY